MVNHYRWDFIGLSTDSKPTPATSEKVTDGSTFYCSDNSKLYVWYKNQWYEKTATGGGGEPYVLPIATADTLGGIKVGDNLVINSETGVLSVPETLIQGTTESFTIVTTDWSALSSSDPYDYSATVTATGDIDATSGVVELLNDAPIDFATYGFAIGAVNASTKEITIYSIGQPSASVTLKINIRNL